MMTARMSRRRRAAFLRALGATGNYAVAAEQSGVSRGWVLKARKEEPRFDAACREIVAGVHARLAAAGAGGGPGGGGAGKGTSWGHLDGVELVVRGTGGSGGGRRVQIGRARWRQWGPRTEDAFLAVLAATCNVKAAYEAVGMSKASAYGHRRRWRAFAERWDEAIEVAAIRLELALARRAQNFFSGRGIAEPVAVPKMSTDTILHNLYMHQNQLYGRGDPPGLPEPEMDREEVHRRLHKAIDIIERGRAVSEEEMAALEADWARRAAAVLE